MVTQLSHRDLPKIPCRLGQEHPPEHSGPFETVVLTAGLMQPVAKVGADPSQEVLVEMATVPRFLPFPERHGPPQAPTASGESYLYESGRRLHALGGSHRD